MTEHRKEPPPHGTHTRYTFWKCRCDVCREATRIYKKRLKEGRHTPLLVDATGTVRRVRALAAIGWSWPLLAAELGCKDRWPGMLANRPTPTVTLTTEAKVRGVFDRLSGTPGPSVRSRKWAERRGWIPPLGWEFADIDDPSAVASTGNTDDDIVDEVAVHRAAKGCARYSGLRPAEQVAAYRLMVARRHGPGVIARMLQISTKTLRALESRATESEAA